MAALVIKELRWSWQHWVGDGSTDQVRCQTGEVFDRIESLGRCRVQRKPYISIMYVSSMYIYIYNTYVCLIMFYMYMMYMSQRWFWTRSSLQQPFTAVAKRQDKLNLLWMFEDHSTVPIDANASEFPIVPWQGSELLHLKNSFPIMKYPPYKSQTNKNNTRRWFREE